MSGAGTALAAAAALLSEESAERVESAAADEVFVYPASFAQERLWFLERLTPGRSTYNVFHGLRLLGELSAPALARAFQGVVDRHEALRTTFAFEADGLVQVISPRRHQPLPRIDLAGLPAAAAAAEAGRLAAAESARPFDLEHGPLLRATLLALPGREHRLLLALHHLVSDAWSMGVLMRELLALYAGILAGETPRLPPLDLQYADYAVWQRDLVAGGELDALLDHWRGALAGLPPLLELPADHPRPAAPSYRGAVVRAALATRIEDLAALTRGERATPFMALFAGFTFLLGRLAGRADVAVGTSVAGRSEVETEALVGLFVNTLVLRIDLAGRATFRELLAAARDVVLAAQAHDDLPFERLVEELSPARDLAYNPLVQVMFELIPRAAPERLPAGLTLAPLGVASPIAKFDLTLALAQGPAGDLGGAFEWSTDLFERTTIERWAGHYSALLAEALRHPDRALADLALAPAAERHQLLVEWNDTARPVPPPGLWALLAARVAEAPDAPAISGPGERWSYRELAERAAGLATALGHAGVGPSDVVAVAAARGPWLLAALLAACRRRAAYLPLSPHDPADRLRRLLADSGAACLLVDAADAAAWEERLGGAPMPIVPLVVAGGGGEDAGDPAEPWPEELAYVIYTSGSTGAPKGAMVEHRGMMNHLWAKVAELGLSPADTVAQTAPATFDISIWQLLAPLLAGGRVHVVADGTLRSPAALLAELERERVSVLELVPSLLGELVEAPEMARRPSGRMPDLRCLLATGEALPADLGRTLAAVWPAVPLVNAYGPTECSDDVTHEWVAAAAPIGVRTPIGRPLANLALFVLDGAGLPAPLGAVGELVVGGVGLGRGYLGDPGRTAERFVPDGVAGLRGERLYRTGDRARWLADGRLDFLGRLDHQVKVRGFRIELGEVEAALAACPGVRDAAAAAVDGAAGDARLVAYLVADEPAPDAARLRASLSERLPEYMVPQRFLALPRLPLTPNGKLDRKALPMPSDLFADEAGAALEPPRTPTEEVLAGIWATVLGSRAPIGRRASFFVLGGHSLSAVRVLSRVRQALGVDLPLERLFQAPELAALAAEIDGARRGGAPPVEGPRPVPRTGPLPLSFAQRRLWFLQELEPESAAYHIPAALRLAGPLEAPALAGALDAVCRRHEILRTTYAVERGEPVQIVHPLHSDRMADWALLDLSALPAARREAEARRRLDEERRRPFALRSAPPLRALLLRHAADDHTLLLVAHHIASDGWSATLLGRELLSGYRALAAGEPFALAGLPLQYADFAAWQRGRAGELATESAWWRERLAGLPDLLDLPLDRPRRGRRAERGAVRPIRWSRELEAAIRAVARDHFATPFMVLWAGLAAVLGRLAGQADLALGSPIAGRARPELEELIGCFVNLLVLRADLGGEPAFGELLGRARGTLVDAYSHQDLPFELLVEELQPARNPLHTPLFQVAVAFDNTPREAAALPVGAARAEELGRGPAKFDLTFALAEAGGAISGALEYETLLFDAATVDRLLEHWQVFLGRALADLEVPIGRLTLASEAAEHQLLHEWGRARGTEPAARTLHGDAEAQARSNPDRVALVADAGCLTYGALAEEAERLALRLHQAGAGGLVGLCAERSLAEVVGILGILRSGAAYLPLDPAHPDERLATVLADAAVSLVVTDRASAAKVARAGGVPLAIEDGASREPTGGALPPSADDPDRLAYVIYTSGSSGRPKGVLVGHRGADLLFRAGAGGFAFGADDTWTLFHSTAFDFSVWEMWGALRHGGRLVLVPAAVRRSPADLRALLARERVTVLNQTPSAFAELVAVEAAGERLADLRLVIFGGERLDLPGLDPWFARYGDERPRLVNGYGITETTVFSTFRPVRRGQVDRPGGSRIGRAQPHVDLAVLDGQGLPVPAGVAGELCLGGAGLAWGYLGRPELTARQFVPHPYGGRAGARLYRSGDQVRWTADGELEYLGRIDQQVKIRGFRIEPGEIGAALEQHEEVERALVVVRRLATGEPGLVAYFTPRGREIDPAALRAFLGRTLPEAMVPSQFVRVSQWPLTANGKVDIRALPEPSEARSAGAVQASRSPDNAREAALIRIWEEVFGVAPIGVDDDFFELGGHSFLAVRLLDRVAAELGTRLPLASLFEEPTLARQAALLAAAERPPSATALVPLTPPREGSLRPPFFCVHSAGGHVLPYRALAGLLGEEQPFYGLEDNRESTGPGGGDLGGTVEAFADRYVEDLRRAWPEGPILLGGWSFGGLVALEMARRLEREGRTVALVALLDTEVGGAETVPATEPEILADLFASLGLPDDAWRPKGPDEQLEILLAELRRQGHGLGEIGLAGARDLLARFKSHVNAHRAYTPEPYAGRVTLFRAEEEIARSGEKSPSAGWERWAEGGVEMVRVQGDHNTMVRPPHVEGLAHRLREAIERALASHPPNPAGGPGRYGPMA